MSDANTFLKTIYEDDSSATVERLGAKIAKQAPIRLGGKTEVELDPQMSPPNISDTKPLTNDPSGTTGDNAQDKIDFPQQRGPTNPQRHLTKMWQDNLEQTTRRAQARQSGKYENRRT
jgi:hypothetical protein